MWLKYLLQKQARMRTQLRGTRTHRIIGERVFRDYLWRHDKRSIAGGLSLGLFLAFTPTIPLQMLLAAFGAVLFRVNLPIALAACWVTNPVTAVPVYLSAWRVGRYTLENVLVIEDMFDWYDLNRGFSRVVKQSAYLWTGSLIYGSVAAVSANIAVRLVWGMVQKSLDSLRARRETDAGDGDGNGTAGI